MNKSLKVLSLFDGISCGYVALKNMGFDIESYDAFEIDEYAIQISKKNHPDIKHHGSVVDYDFSKFEGYDLILAGFPCQAFSFAGHQKGFDDERGSLFFELLRALKQVNPKYFLLENTKMKKEYSDEIDRLVGVKHIMLDSASLSAQSRKRLYWTNIQNVTQPKDLGILIKDIIHENEESMVKITDRNLRHYKELDDKSLCLTATCYKGAGNNGMTLLPQKLKHYIVPFDETFNFLEKEVAEGKMGYFRKDSQANRVYYLNNKGVTLCGAAGGGAAKMGQYFISLEPRKIYTLSMVNGDGLLEEGYIRKLTPIECERLQTLPDNYTQGVSDSQRYKMIGNGWTVAIIEHILKGLNDGYKCH